MVATNHHRDLMATIVTSFFVVIKMPKITNLYGRIVVMLSSFKLVAIAMTTLDTFLPNHDEDLLFYIAFAPYNNLHEAGACLAIV